ncbi:terminase [Desulfosporosinus sp. SB140]|uniref:XkdQ/YqbQ family protein n=1 Tax=Desulfosporosinus paludis TaxID=3115649 RepID=UPI00388DCCF5
MIKLYSLYNGVVRDITNAIKSISSTGDKAQVARKLDIALAYPIWDRSQPRAQIRPGTKVWLLMDGKEIFRGLAWDREINSDSEELTFPAYDYLIYLTKSKVTYNFVNITPEDATRQICFELGVETGDIASTGIKVNRLLAQKTGYEAIMEMYTQASKTNGKKYIPVMDGAKLCVIEKGKVVTNYTLRSQFDDTNNNVLSTSYKDTLDGMVNKVKIYDSENNYVGEVCNSSWINEYGLIQENYIKEADKDSDSVANGMLTDLQTDVTISALGNWDCRTGYAVNSKIFYVSTLQNTVMYIEGDTHTWEPATGKYTMSLNLSFKNQMDSKGD